MKELTVVDLAWTDEESVSFADSIRGKPGVIVLPSRVPAHVVARVVSEMPGAVLVIADDKTHGLAFPEFLIHRFNERNDASAVSLADLVGKLDSAAGDEVLRGILAMRPTLVWCEGGKHWVSKLGCHPSVIDPHT